MVETRLQQLAHFGQSVWYDNLSRDLLRQGRLASLIEQGVLGVTANPTIFEHALASSDAYDQEISELAWRGLGNHEIYERLIVQDVRAACDQMAPVFFGSGRNDGYVSLEVSPRLAHDPQGTVSAAEAYWAAVDRPNLMVKIPATKEGVTAVEEAITRGLNINVTLIFSAARYRQVMAAYCRGLERRLESGLPIADVRSVASFFVSRVDTEVDRRLDRLAVAADGELRRELASVHGTAAIANAAVAYAAFEDVFRGPRFETLKAAGAAVQRPLWASTSTKNPAYKDVLYCEELIAPDTVNTMPPTAIDAFLDHGLVRGSLAEHIPSAAAQLARLDRLGVDVDAVTELLEREGVESFAASMEKLLAEIGAKRERLGSRGVVASPRTRFVATATVATATLGGAQEAVAGEWERLVAAEAVARRFGQPAAPPDSPEAPARPDSMRNLWHRPLDQLKAHATWVRDQGFRHALLIGADGGSLGPRAMRQAFGVASGFPDLLVLNSVHPDLLAAAVAAIDPTSTLLLVASTGGAGINETMALGSFFSDLLQRAVGAPARDASLAAAEPGSELEQLATELGFGRIVSLDPEVSGASTVISELGLLAAATIGVDLDQLLAGGAAMAAACAGETANAVPNPGLQLASILGGCARDGRNKVTFVTDPELAQLPGWISQLWVENASGSSLIPVLGEPRREVVEYAADRLFVYLHLEGSAGAVQIESWLDALAQAGHPVVVITTTHLLDLGAEFVRWQVAWELLTWSADRAHGLPPPLEEGERELESVLGVWTSERGLPDPPTELVDDWLEIAGPDSAQIVGESLRHWLEGMAPPGYIAIAAHLATAAQPAELAAELQELRAVLGRNTHCATTLGWTPPGSAVGTLQPSGEQVAFLQITTNARADPAIPGRVYSFGVLQQARALSEYLVVRNRGARVLRVHLADVGSGVHVLLQAADDLLSEPVR
ncbi:MAG: bifunctional transaldolase/phosoglucose isomerase [Candidatus Dormibacteria bacterium]